MSPNLQRSQTTSTGGKKGGLLGGLKRALGSGGLFLTRYGARTDRP